MTIPLEQEQLRLYRTCICHLERHKIASYITSLPERPTDCWRRP
uniref:Uncharacterized protein n=1 Tax=Calidris pygmaea TaxID=425635 RepID=A0A8C3KD24_9CHAR